MVLSQRGGCQFRPAYLQNNPDVLAAGAGAFWHFLTRPSAERAAANPDVAAAHVDPLKDFLQFGIHEGRAALADTT
jgi:hypothetical protein